MDVMNDVIQYHAIDHLLTSLKSYDKQKTEQESPHSARKEDETRKNIRGGILKDCSTDGMAKTGYGRDNKCARMEGDKGNHHVCVDLNTSAERNFCHVTGQSNWCDQEGACVEDDARMCKRQKWCVCEWAFSKAVDAHGCDAFLVDCDATSDQVLRSYDKDPIKHQKAIQCLERKCYLP